MAYIKVLLIFTLACTVSNAVPIQNDGSETNMNEIENSNYRLPNNTVPMHYKIKLIPDIEETSTFEGEVVIDFKVREPTPNVALHSKNLTLNESETRLTSEKGDSLVPESYTYNSDTEILVLHFNKSLEIGIYSLNMLFRGNFGEDLCGFYVTAYKDDKGNKAWMAATQFEPVCARTVFPCWDEPALKATFDISIKHFTNYTALSNMPAKKETEPEVVVGKVWTRFETTPIMSTYLVAFVVGDLVNVSNADGTINVWSRKEIIPYSKYIHEIAQKATIELKRYTNGSVLVPKMDHVAVLQHSAGAMENWGLITYHESFFVYKEGESTLTRKFRVTATVIHELTHQWFGNVVSPTWWSHLWLNEGFASYFEYYIIDKFCKNSRAMDFFVVSTVEKTLSMDGRRRVKPIDVDVSTPDEIESKFSVAAYNKAPSILHMLSNIISPEVFRTGLVKYLDEHKYDSADPDCLWDELQNALNESNIPHSDFNLKEVMDTWIKQKRYPLVTVERNYSTGVAKLMQEDFRQMNNTYFRYNDTDDESNQWWIPINYATERNLNFSQTWPTHWLKPNTSLTIDGLNSDDWVIFNNQHSGYYRVNYDESNWKKISKYLHSENYTKIHVLNRAQIMSDATHLMMFKRLNPSIFLEIFKYLSRETDFIPWYPVFNFFEEIMFVLELPSAAPIKALILDIMSNLIKSVGFEECPNDDDFTILKRTETLKWACKLSSPECMQAATVKLNRYLDDPEANRISPNLKTWVFENGMRRAEESVWNKGFEVYMRNQSNDVLRSLSFTENPVLIAKYLSASMSNDTVIPKNHQEKMYSFAIHNSRVVSVVINSLMENWNKVTERSEDIVRKIPIIVYNITTEDQLEKLRQLCDLIRDSPCMEEVLMRRLKRINEMNSVIQEWLNLL